MLHEQTHNTADSALLNLYLNYTTPNNTGKTKMLENDSAIELTREIRELIPVKMGHVFEKYDLKVSDMMTQIKWKPLVLIIGNYSSGKSTFINEIAGQDVQLTGQAPTDDSFTIITAPEEDENAGELPGSTVVNDTRMPFTALKHHGESLIAHIRMKKINSPALENMAIIDTPGMLDSVTEKDRGYDYLSVIGEFARLADMIVLMFDPHKAGTIKETYNVIRSTLPGTAGEDRTVFVLNRIDECENIVDLLRTYGTLCWNLSQMTGRKDIPKIFLSYADTNGAGSVKDPVIISVNERSDLKKTIYSAPGMRLNHILQEVDRSMRELALEIEAVDNFRTRFIKKLSGFGKTTGLAAAFAFLFGDFFMHLITGYPATPFVSAVAGPGVSSLTLIWPTVWTLLIMTGAWFYMQKLMFPGFLKNSINDIDSLISLNTAYKQDIWIKVRKRTSGFLQKRGWKVLITRHNDYLKSVKEFIDRDLSRFYVKINRKIEEE